MEQVDVEEELAMDRRIYGSCFWRVVDGRKVRIHPCEVVIDSKGRIIAPTRDVQSDSASTEQK